jgi:hypothetical protein
MYAMLQTTLAAQDDVGEVLAYLLAVIAASHRYEKYQTEELIEQIIEQATLALDQIFGLRAMPLHRPDFDQMSELIRAANAARANAGLDPLPVLKQ